MATIVLTRHGHVEGIKPERFRGRRETPLTALGRAQANAVAARIARTWKPAAIYTSPMGRCIETGAAIAKACDVAATPIHALNDLDYGTWEWRTLDEMRAAEPALYACWFTAPERMRFPGGETLAELVARTAGAIRLVQERHARDTVVLVGHLSVNRALLLQCLDMPLSAYWRLEQFPCTLNEIAIEDGRMHVLRVNDAQHTEGLS
ncbi:MAG TPA: histidine phosphatase family protein [Stellaceae bacterium]|jgi:phosphoserine phosphatase|nr:histidine phosphatase family protein [Stellaceae bacterium]